MLEPHNYHFIRIILLSNVIAPMALLQFKTSMQSMTSSFILFMVPLLQSALMADFLSGTKIPGQSSKHLSKWNSLYQLVHSTTMDRYLLIQSVMIGLKATSSTILRRKITSSFIPVMKGWNHVTKINQHHFSHFCLLLCDFRGNSIEGIINFSTLICG